MPIRPELRKFYGVEWRAVRARILARAKNRCEQCDKPNGERVETHTGKTAGIPVMFWRAVSCSWRNQWGESIPPGRTFGWMTRTIAFPPPAAIDPPAGRTLGWTRTITVVLTIGHLNHVAGDDREENLRAFCQWCHLHYDQSHHRETRSIRKDASRPLLEEGYA